MGLAAYGRPTHDRRGPQVDPAHAGRRVRPRHGLLRVPDDGRAIVFAAIRRAVRPSAQSVRADRPRDRRRPALRRLRRQRPAGPRGHARGHDARAASRNRACRICVWRVAWRSTASPTRGFLPSPASSACSSRPLPAMRAARSGRRSMPIASTSATRTGTCPIIRSGDRRSTRRSWRGRRARMARSSKSSTTRRSSNGSRTSSPPAASSAGWTAPPSSARARSAIAAFWPRRTRARCATGSIATSSIARSSGRSRR